MDKGKSMLLDLLNTQNQKSQNYAILELGKLEASLNNYDEAKKYFLLLLNTDAKDFSFIELNDGSCLKNLQIIAKNNLRNIS